MNGERHRVERVLQIVMAGGVRISAVCLIVGLALWLGAPELAAADRLLNAGIVILMATPALRVVLSAAEAIRLRDWQHVAAILTVAVLLALTLTYAARS